MSRRAAKGMLRAAGILELQGNGRWKVGEARLRERLPDVYDRVFEHFELRVSEPARSGSFRPEPAGTDQK